MPTTRTIRLCHVQVLPLLSGAQRSMLEIIRHTDRQRFETHVACQSYGPMTTELQRMGINVHLIPSLDRPIQPYRDLMAYRELAALFQREQFDVVHTHSSKPGFLGRIAARMAGVPCVVHHVRGFSFHDFSSWQSRFIFSRLEKCAGRFCDRVLFVNREEHDLAIRGQWLPPEKCRTIYNGADLTALSPNKREPVRTNFRVAHGINDNDVAILFSARLDYQKQPMLIPEIANRLEAARPRASWKFLIAGSGEYEELLREQIKKHSLEHRVLMLGWQENPFDSLRAADVVLMTSLFEGLPRTLIEAQACGLPIVAGNAKGVREVVNDDTGFLCTPTDPAAYASHLAMLIDSKVLRTQMGYHARKRAEKLFDTVTNNRQIVALYEELLAEKGIGTKTTEPTTVPALHRQAA